MNDRTPTATTTAEVEGELLAFLVEHTRKTLDAEDDIFALGLVSSLFAMQLVMHLEQAYRVTVTGDHLRLDNFRSAHAMAALVRDLGGCA